MLSPVTILRLSAMIKRNVHPQRMKMKKEEKDEFEKMADDDDNYEFFSKPRST